MSARLWLIIPTYNEAENLVAIVDAVATELQRVLPDDFRILIVDDNSPDGTGRMADELASRHGYLEVLHRTAKNGLGQAYIAGFARALDGGAELVFEMDADFSHDPRFLPTFLDAVQDADLVIGSRYKSGVNVINWPISRLLLSIGANQYARVVTGLPLTDSTGGFKCFRRRVLEAIPLERVRSNGYAFQIEMSFLAWKKGFRIREIPIVFTDRVEGQSKMNGKIVREAVWMVWWLRLRSLRGAA